MTKRPEHLTDGYDCWCGPEHYVACPECSTGLIANEEAVPPGGVAHMRKVHTERAGHRNCARCAGGAHAGLIALTREAAQWTDAAVLTVHRDVELA